jgi:hypothetical protein
VLCWLVQHNAESVDNVDVSLQRWGGRLSSFILVRCHSALLMWLSFLTGGINVHDVAVIREIYGWVPPKPQDCVCPTLEEYKTEIVSVLAIVLALSILLTH